MSKFLVVLSYELKEYFKNKGFVITTLALALLASVVLFSPRFINFSGDGDQGKNGASEDIAAIAQETGGSMAIYDGQGLVDQELLGQVFLKTEWITAEDAAAVKSMVESQSVDAGFVVRSLTEYDYYVLNKNMDNSSNTQIFDAILQFLYQQDYCVKNNMDFATLRGLSQAPIQAHENILGKDMEQNFGYCYGLVVFIFFMILYYGQMLAVSVTNEKSNRAMEVLITSTSPNHLLFGKVLAGAMASLFQMGVILGSVLFSYQMNRELWGGAMSGALEGIFHIPGEVLVTFAFFGLGGYLFFAFLYGAMGALVSRTEDVSKTSSGLTMVIMLVYFGVLFQLGNVDGTLMKVLSFLPVSSYSAMFVRIAMGAVATWEVVLSFLILVASTVGIGFLGAKIYRMGTLRYGNPISFTKALRELKKQ